MKYAPDAIPEGEGYAGCSELAEPIERLTPEERQPMLVPSVVLGGDHYHSNLTVVPAATIAADRRFRFEILKCTESTVYHWADTWFPPNVRAVRRNGLKLGAYHFLRPGDGAAQARFYLSKAKLRPGDIVPICDVEDSSIQPGTVRDFIKAVRDAGFPKVMGYGRRWFIDHGITHAALGFDFAWKPRYGPASLGEPATLWQYTDGPFNGTSWPNHAPGCPPGDVSAVLTRLPLIQKEDDLAILSDQEQKALKTFLDTLRKDLGTQTGSDQPPTPVSAGTAAKRVAGAVRKVREGLDVSGKAK